MTYLRAIYSGLNKDRSLFLQCGIHRASGSAEGQKFAYYYWHAVRTASVSSTGRVTECCRSIGYFRPVDSSRCVALGTEEQGVDGNPNTQPRTECVLTNRRTLTTKAMWAIFRTGVFLAYMLLGPQPEQRTRDSVIIRTKRDRSGQYDVT